MNKKITEALDFAESTGLSSVVLAIPFPVSVKDIVALRELPICKALVLCNPSPKITATFTSERLGCFENGGWRLPTARARVVFVGGPQVLTRRMAIQLIKSRRLSVVCKINGVYQQLFLHSFLLWRAGEKIVRHINEPRSSRILRKSHEILKNIPILNNFLRTAFSRELWSSPSISLGVSTSDGVNFEPEALYEELLLRAHSSAKTSSYCPFRRRVLLVNSGLAAGGAERQIVNTLIGLRDSGECESVGLLTEYIDYLPGLDFFLRELETASIEVSQVDYAISLSDDGLSSVSPEVARLLAHAWPGLIEDVLNLIEEFRARKPEVVHAWQDQTSIKVGIAAVIAGVPRIVLASRNVAAINFDYYQDHMRPVYRALAKLGNVKFINNSEIGAQDYSRWLALPRERFNVVRNGVDLRSFQRIGVQDVAHYRTALGIPRSAPVVGSVFRFWPEKRPILWLETAALIIRQFSDVHFIIIGEGPMRLQMEKFVRERGLAGRVHLPGARSDIATALSAMDVFLLTSEFEGTPNVLLEAQWLGLPIVATDSGGTRESFAAGETGLLATTSDPGEIASLVDLLLRNPTLMTACAQKGRDFVVSHFRVDQMIEETLAVYGFNHSRRDSEGARREAV